MRGRAKAAIVGGAAVAGYLAGLIAGAIAWSLLGTPMAGATNGSDRDGFLWGVIGALAGTGLAILVALLALARRSPAGRGRAERPLQGSV